jgi:hypothetical protein
MPDEFDRLFRQFVPEFETFARRIFDAGGKAERDRLRDPLLALLQASGQDAQPAAAARAARKSRERWATYGSVSAPIREALNELSADSLSGVTVADLVAFFELRGTGPTEKQIRAALKNLSKPSGEAVNIARGKYLSRSVSESRSAEKPGDDAPGSFNHAA